ncbi:chorismate mutase, partial [Xenorhabdus indica]|uniref:chorismate mutase n=1 Tax=Xenorhabdus indica TaxID=333964 RepID=UPI0030B8E02D
MRRSTLLMMSKIISTNELQCLDLVSCFFTVTPDLTSELPPLIIYEAGWKNLPTLCALEVKTSMMIPRTIRMLIHVQWNHENRKPNHIYLPEVLSSKCLFKMVGVSKKLSPIFANFDFPQTKKQKEGL